jgi:hypothetical protein
MSAERGELMRRQILVAWDVDQTLFHPLVGFAALRLTPTEGVPPAPMTPMTSGRPTGLCADSLPGGKLIGITCVFAAVPTSRAGPPPLANIRPGKPAPAIGPGTEKGHDLKPERQGGDGVATLADGHVGSCGSAAGIATMPPGTATLVGSPRRAVAPRGAPSPYFEVEPGFNPRCDLARGNAARTGAAPG